MKKMIYADNSATTAVAPEVLEAMLPFFTQKYFNPNSMYEVAAEVLTDMTAARRTIADFLGGVDPQEVVFTACATESNNMALFGAASACTNPARKHIITSAVEHPAILEVCHELKRRGYDLTILPVDKTGQIAVRDFVKALRPDETLLVSLMHANNETGVLFPIDEFARITKETHHDILFHTDATQSAGKLPLNLKEDFKFVDMLSFSGHKMHAPKGVGVLYMRRGTPLRPLLYGGHQESNRRGGTQNVAFMVGLAKACELAQQAYSDETRLRHLRDTLEDELIARVPYLEVNGRGAPRLPNTLNLACHFVEGESLLMQLDDEGICASSGSACSSGSLDPSHVLKAMNIPFTALHGSVRLTFSRYNTEDDFKKIADIFPRLVANLRNLSPYWDQKTNTPRDTHP